MKRHGEIVIAQPEDYLLTGEELEDLTAKLAPAGVRLREMAGETGYNSELIDASKEVVLDTLEALGCAASNVELQAVINTCWSRSETIAYDDAYTNRGHALGSAVFACLREGSVTTEEFPGWKFILPQPKQLPSS